ncbi:TRMT12 [Bugula neritina]|uniref:TRMT12 n=1 Tax=Bugula neritina TaxID=10212 RepID=A0A7J7JST1_BUGNE|nr:TRMT12 [Bugula neritina]
MEPLVATSGLVGDLGTGVPIEQVSSLEHDGRLSKKHKLNLLPQLPSHKFEYTVWHELRSTQVKGDQLHAPRVREGPESKERTFYELADDDGELIHHDRKGKERSTYRDKQENWESAMVFTTKY